MINKLITKYIASKQKYLYMMSYFLIAVISIIINLFGYAVSIRVIKDDLRRSSLSALQNVQSVFDYNFSNVINSAYNVLQSNSVKQMFNNSNMSNWQKTKNMESISVDLQNTIYGQKFIEESIVLSKKKNFCITSTGSAEYRIAYDTYFDEYYDTIKQWEDDFFDVRVREFKFIRDHSGKMNVFIVYKIPEENADKYMVIKINSIAVNANLKSLGETLEKYYITDNGGNVIFSTKPNDNSEMTFDLNSKNKTVTTSEEKQAVTITDSSFEGLKYIRCVPEKIYLRQIRLVRLVFIAGYIICIVIGFLFANMFSEIIEKSRRKLLDKIAMRDMSMRKHIIRQILVGGVSKDNIARVLQQNDIQLSSRGLIVVLFDFSQTEDNVRNQTDKKIDISELLVYLEQYYREEVKTNAYFCEIKKTCFGIMNLNSDDSELFKNNTEKLYERITETFKIRFVCAVSSVFSSLTEINRAYEQTLEIINLCFLGNEKTVLCYDDVMNNVNGFDIDSSTERKLINYVVLGEKTALKQFITEMYEYNCNVKKNSIGMLRVLTVEIVGIVLKAAFQTGTAVDYRNTYKIFTQINSVRSTEELKNIAMEYALSCCIEKTEIPHSKKKYDAVVEYIENNYSDPMLNGNMLADIFKINRSYLSENFKKYVGDGLADYIVKYRLKKAKEILQQDETINKVAMSVGFSSTVVFNRAFKKFEGITPTQFKKLIN